MVSVSGIRGIVGDGLDPNELVKYSSAFADFCGKGKIVIGRDSRITGEMVKNIVTGTLLAKGFDVVDIGICPTPTVLFNTRHLNASGGIAITASHNPNQWNALKLLNSNGEFMTKEENAEMLEYLDDSVNNYSDWENVGKLSYYKEGINNHIEKILSRDVFDIEAIRKKQFKVLLDCVNGAGSFVMPEFLEQLGCEVIKSDCEKSGIFPRLPEPIPENLTDTIKKIKSNNVDLGIVVDPDVDRLVLITEKGEPFGEEYTVAQAVRFVTNKQKGNVAVNLSTTRAVDDLASANGCEVYRSPVGEANVVSKMKEVDAVIGGEGSGGIIYPDVLYGRDALTGTVIILQHLIEFGGTIGDLKKAMPQYQILKDKIDISGKDPDSIINKMIERYSNETINTEDGLRIDFEDHWVHLRKSNTEPIIRCITEAKTLEESQKYMDKYFGEIKDIAG
jgi:phosphomannomutase